MSERKFLSYIGTLTWYDAFTCAQKLMTWPA